MLAQSFQVFSERYDFMTDVYLTESMAEVGFPSEADIFEYCNYVTQNCKMENEIPIICLVYLERLIMKTGILLTVDNWRRLTLISLCLGSKVWDDDSLENVHFPKVLPDVTLRMINSLEEKFLEFIDFDLVIKGSEYAKYYFILRTLSDDIKLDTPQIFKAKAAIDPKSQSPKQKWNEFPLRAPISADKMQYLQRNSAKAEAYLK
jgi:hypothetical protein